ncbi:relaxase/mobilization nuclease domain-containing protein [Chitinophaga sp. 22321]|uniref:Relaxase/mobilization nuclease domain-containing protein n=1 Tax=Chitinophaga hostae TaxID=2831022 RepID=A0ABS5J7S0_9BACT|nr:relaxase/mobilization nuclease domain-containing protein [Chitinophaga hostae]MBS0031244.1 relaxase/mobilization nuclease domain-containing protein [Chitinophaga hostae]
MIGYVGTGSSFLGCIQYCLNDKKDFSEKQKADLSQKDGLKHQGRAKILSYNRCFGNPKELAQQFRDVAKLSRRVEKPVFHFSLRLAPGESLSRNQLEEIGHECAKEFGVADNQYICVLHKDTTEQHIHLVANRVGLDGKAASDSNSYKRMAALCRRLEKQYHLQEVLSPKPFLSPNERLLPRNDSRKDQLQRDIRQTLIEVNSFDQFGARMKELGYTVLKGRGIAFIDSKKVKIKGSEVGFPLYRIEKILNLKQTLNTSITRYNKCERARNSIIQKDPNASQRLFEMEVESSKNFSSTLAIEEIVNVLNELLKTEHYTSFLPYELTLEGYNRRRKREARKKGVHF